MRFKSTTLIPTIEIPEIHSIRSVKLPRVELHHLANGIPVYLVEGGNQALCRLDVSVAAGRIHEEKKLASVVCMHMLKEGSQSYTSTELAERFENEGASLAFPFSFDAINAAVITLSRNFNTIAPLMAEIICRPQFPQAELDALKERIIAKLSVDLMQNDVVAYRTLTEHIFGADHPYGYNSTEPLYRSLQHHDLVNHHQRRFGMDSTTLFLSGNPPHGWRSTLEHAFGEWTKTVGTKSVSQMRIPEGAPYIEEEGSGLQTAIRIGRSLYDAAGGDFGTITLLNAILGGYYGSRLMRNLREEKGLTYGVHSSFDTFAQGGYLSISVETERQNTKEVLACIREQIERLQNDLVSQDELQMVRNYLGGYFLSLVDGPFPTAEIMRISLLESGNIHRLESLLEEIWEVTSDQLRDAAQAYLNLDQLTQVVIH